MKIHKSIILTACSLFSIISMAQKNASELTLEDLVPGGKTFSKYRVEYPRQVQWWNDVPLQTKGDSIVTIAFAGNALSEVFLNRKILNEGLEAAGKQKIGSLANLKLPYRNKKIALLNSGDETYLFDFELNKIVLSVHLPSGIANNTFSKESNSFAYTKENNLYVMTPDGKELAVTSYQDKGIVCGQTVHRNEFGIDGGIFWSPTGKHLAFYQMDETMVTDYPLVDISTRIATLKNTKYPMAGMKSHHVTVGVFDLAKQKTVYLKTGTPKERYLTNIAWSADEESIYMAEINRGQDTCCLNRYNAATGKLEATLFVETHPKYVEPQTPILFLKTDPQLFIWQSRRDGFNHLYLYNANGILKKQLTQGSWDITEVVGFDQLEQNLYYISTEISPIEKHIYQLNLKTGKRTKLSKEEGVHRAQLSTTGKYILDTYSSLENPGKCAITETKSNKTDVFYTANNPYKDITLAQISLGSIKANDGKTDLYYRLTKPTNIDPNKKYPVIVYVYGGPHSQLVENAWMGKVGGWDIFMAQKGYIVFTLDNRGTQARGFDFENITHRQLGVIETQDQMSGVEFLKSLPFVDSSRIGVSGWSYGGFMTLNLMLRHPETFKVGVAGGPVTDWKYYEIMYGERYMDSPKENPEGYTETSMLNRAGDLKGRLLLIHGDEDPTVVMQQNLQFLKSAIKQGTHPDLFIYPGHGHNMTGHDRVHLMEHITRYFDDFLK